MVQNDAFASQIRNLKDIFKTACRDKQIKNIKGMVKDYGFASRAGQLTNSKIKDNQDSLIIETKLTNNRYLFGVADGHGQFGDRVSKFIKNAFPRKI